MKQIKINEKEITFIEGWNEITLGNYIDLINLYAIKDSIIEDQFMAKFIPMISTLTEQDIMSLYPEDMELFMDIICNFQLEKFIKEEKRNFIFPDSELVYTVVTPNKLTIGENISLKLLEKSATGVLDSWLNLLSILIRPASVGVNEFNETTYTPLPFEGDMDILMKRKELFKTIPAVNAMWVLEAFTLGRK